MKGRCMQKNMMALLCCIAGMIVFYIIGLFVDEARRSGKIVVKAPIKASTNALNHR